MSIEIRQHTPGDDLKDFIRVPHLLFKDSPVWVPPLNMMIKEQLTPRKNPLFEHTDVALFTARKNGELVGRISAQIDREHLKRYKDYTGFFGFFDTINDEEVAQKLVDVASDWVESRGMKCLRGPFSLSINEELGLLVEGFDTPQVFLMPHSTPYQGHLAEATGLKKVKDVLAWKFSVGNPKQRAVRAWEQITQMEEVRIRSVDRSNLNQEIKTVLDIYNDAWSDNWGMVPTTPYEGRKVAEDMKLVLNPDLAFIVEIDGEPAAMCIALPNLNEVIRDLNGQLFPFGVLKLIWRLKINHPKSARVVMLGIRKKFRQKKRYGGLALAICNEICIRGVRNGYQEGELSWTLEDNIPINLTIRAMGGKRYKTYRIYEKQLDT